MHRTVIPTASMTMMSSMMSSLRVGEAAECAKGVCRGPRMAAGLCEAAAEPPRVTGTDHRPYFFWYLDAVCGYGGA